jgi:hypothetical protein
MCPECSRYISLRNLCQVDVTACAPLYIITSINSRNFGGWQSVSRYLTWASEYTRGHSVINEHITLGPMYSN